MKNGTSQSHHRQSSVLIYAVLALFLFASPTIAEDHSGSTGTATWTLANSPHIIIGEVTVGNGDTLTV